MGNMPPEKSRDGRWERGAVFVPYDGAHARHKVRIVNPELDAKITVQQVNERGEPMTAQYSIRGVLVRCQNDLHSWIFEASEEIEGVAEFI